MKNNKGFAVTTVVYSILILLSLFMFMILGTLRNTYSNQKEFTDGIKEELNNRLNYEEDLEGNLANDWKEKTENETSYLALYTLDTKYLPSTYSYDGTTYTLDTTIDVSEQENNSVLLGEYKNDSNLIAVIGQNGGVEAPVVSTFLLSLAYYDSNNRTFISNVQVIDLSNFDTSKVTNMSDMFEGCTSLISLDVSKFDTSNVTNMYGMFSNCRNLTNLNLSNFNTNRVLNMKSMFYRCEKLTSLDLSSFDTSNVSDMGSMFYDCNNLTTLDVSHFDTSNVTNMNHVFYQCSSLTSLDLSNFNTTKVIAMSFVFAGCRSLPSLDLSNFDTSNVTNMGYMFERCSSLTSLNLNNFDTSKVTDMSFMFCGCNKLINLDLSNFDTLNVINMEVMFAHCNSLTKVTVGCNWVIGSSTTTTNMFSEAGVKSVTKEC